MDTPRNVCMYRGHSAYIGTLAWSPDGRRVVSGSADGTAQIWDSATGEALVIYQGHSGSVDAVAWSPDGTYIASAGSDATVQVWGAATGELTYTYHGHSAWIRRGLAWSPDGRFIASGSWDKTVQVWEAFSGKSMLTYRGHQGIVCAVAWSPDGNSIASGGGIPDKRVHIWEVRTGRLLVTYRDHPSSVHAVAWSPDGTRMASAGLRSRTRVWEAWTGTNVTSTNMSTGPVAWSVDGTMLILPWYKSIEVWEVREGKCLASYPTGMYKIDALGLSPDGIRIAFGGYDTTIEVWDLSPRLPNGNSVM